MRLSRWLFGFLYRIGFTPWEGHAQSPVLDKLIGKKGKSLDIGCGTGDTTIRLAKEGWDATGVDFVEKALERARKKAAAAAVKVRYLRADATQLSSFGVGGGYDLITDNGCMHGLDDQQLDAYAREVTQAAAPGAQLLIIAFLPGKRRGPRGIDAAGIERHLTGWKLLETGPESWKSKAGEILHHYLLQKS
jgi:SAM-dependent methyltransferase